MTDRGPDGRFIATGTVRIEADSDGFAEEVRANVDEATAKPATIKVNADTTEANAKIDETKAKLHSLNEGGLGPLGVGAAALLPLLAPLAGGLTAVAGAGAAALASGGGLALIVEQNVKSATTAYTQLQAAQKAVDEATSKNSLNDALIKQKALIDSLSPSTVALGQTVHGLSDEWKSFSNQFVPDTNILVQGVSKLATDSLPKLQPLIQNTFGVAGILIKELDNSINSNGGRGFFSWLSIEGPKDLRGIAEGVGSLGAGFGHLIQAFSPVETQFVNGFDRISSSFNKWTQGLDTNSGFQKFLTTVEKDGPEIVHTLGQVADAGGHILAGFQPLLPYELGFVNFITSVVINHPALATALAGMFTGFEALKIIGTLTGPFALLVNIAEGGLTKMGAFALSEQAVGASAKSAAPEVAALGGAMDATAASGSGLLGILGRIGAFAGIGSLAELGAAAGGGALVGGLAAGIGYTQDKAYNALKSFVNQFANAGHGGGGNADGSTTDNDPGLATAYGPAPPPFYLAKPGGPSQPMPTSSGQPSSTVGAGYAGVNSSTTSNLSSTYADQIGGGSAYNPSNPGGAYIPPKNAGNNPVLPFSAGGGSAAATLAANNAAAYAQTLGLDIMGSLAQGVTTGTNPLTQAFGNLNQKLTGQAQTLGTALESAFSSTLAYGQAAAASMKSNLLNSPSLGSQTSIFMDANGHSTTSFQAAGPNALYGLQQTLATDKHFAGDISKLRQLGLANDLVDQLVQGGPGQSTGIADSILGDPSQIKQLNSVNSQINSTANTYGIQQAQAQSLAQVVTLFQQLIALERTAPGVIVAGINAGLASTMGGGAKTAQLKASTTPSKGVLAR